jgi:predicted neuraminidase
MRNPLPFLVRVGLLTLTLLLPQIPARAREKPFCRAEFIFPLEHWHNHGSCLVETPKGDLIVSWFHGAGERTADDVKIEGARKRKGATRWSPRFTMADTPDYPDTNCAMFIDPEGRLWLLWPTILANLWESALMKYHITTDYHRDGPPKWTTSEVLHVTPGAEFESAVTNYVQETIARLTNSPSGDVSMERTLQHLNSLQIQATDKLQRRLGWMTRAHPFVFEGRRLIVPLYSDGFSFSLMALSDDWGKTWRTSNPLIGAGNIQPSIVQRRDGSLYTVMRDNGPPPKRLQQSESRDGGETWSPVTDSDIINPGTGSEIISLRNGNWALIGNDTEKGRHSLVVQISDDEGKTWKWQRHLETEPGNTNKPHAYSYPSLIQARDGTLHATYSYHLGAATEKDAQGQPARKSIKYVHFNEAWVKQGDGN